VSSSSIKQDNYFNDLCLIVINYYVLRLLETSAPQALCDTSCTLALQLLSCTLKESDGSNAGIKVSFDGHRKLHLRTIQERNHNGTALRIGASKFVVLEVPLDGVARKFNRSVIIIHAHFFGFFRDNNCATKDNIVNVGFPNAERTSQSEQHHIRLRSIGSRHGGEDCYVKGRHHNRVNLVDWISAFCDK